MCRVVFPLSLSPSGWLALAHRGGVVEFVGKLRVGAPVWLLGVARGDSHRGLTSAWLRRLRPADTTARKHGRGSRRRQTQTTVQNSHSTPPIHAAAICGIVELYVVPVPVRVRALRVMGVCLRRNA